MHLNMVEVNNERVEDKRKSELLKPDLCCSGLVCPPVVPVGVEEQPVLVVHVGPDSGHVGPVPRPGLEAPDPRVGGDRGDQVRVSHQGVVTLHQRGQWLATPNLQSSAIINQMYVVNLSLPQKKTFWIRRFPKTKIIVSFIGISLQIFLSYQMQILEKVRLIQSKRATRPKV